jgi:high-affinity iron transporter
MELQAFLITFREALEAILIVGVIITYLKFIDQTKWNKYVWVGVILALLTSYGVALAFQVVFTGFGAMANQVYLKVGIMIISTALLTHMIMFMNQQRKQMSKELQSKVAMIISTGGALNMIVHSYLVVVRWGALLGVVLALIIGLAFFRGARKIKLANFFKISSIFLVLIAAGLFVQAVGILQDLKIIGSVYTTPGGQIGQVYNIDWLMPEHPQDEEHYIRDTGNEPLINGQVGIFFKAFLGYNHDPSVEEFLAYWAYFIFIFFLTIRQKQTA